MQEKQTKKIPFLSLNSCMLDGAVTNRFQSLTCLFGAIAVINEKPQKMQISGALKKREESKLKMHAVEIHYINIL